MVGNNFNHGQYVQDIIQDLGLSYDTVVGILQKYTTYTQNIYQIPITIWAEPTPYSPLRINYKTGRLYVPNKAKLVETIRKLILTELGTSNFQNHFFPRFNETILHSSLYIPTPKAFNKENTLIAEMKILRPICTPDLDNCSKIINDAVKSFIIYDDAQIVSEIYEKYYSTKPRMEITIIYNASPLLKIHQKTIEQRRERWENMQSQNPPSPAISLLRKRNCI